MRQLIWFSFLIVLPFQWGLTQNNMAIPAVDLKTLHGEMVPASSLLGDTPVILSFWATWCTPCLKELTVLQEVLPEWQEELEVKLVAISVDDVRSEHRVAPFVKGRGWDFAVYLDPNADLKRAMNVPSIPHTFLFDPSGKIVWQHSGYHEGDEEELLLHLRTIKSK